MEGEQYDLKYTILSLNCQVFENVDKKVSMEFSSKCINFEIVYSGFIALLIKLDF